MKAKRLIVLAVLTATMVATAIGSPAPARAQTPDPVLVGAGDIVTCGTNGDEETANLLDSIGGTVFTLGDNVYPDGTAAQFTDCYGASWGRHKARTMPAPGNHDYHTTGAAGYFGYFGKAASPLDNNCTSNCKGYYSYNLGAWHVIVLNSETDFSTGSAQDQWLRADLAANQTACTLAYWHEPLYSSGLHGNATRVRPLWNTLYQYGADVVLNGHDHTYERFAPQNPNGQADAKGIREFVVGTGGASMYTQASIQPNSEAHQTGTLGVLKLTLHAASYDWEFVPVAGKTYKDSGSANCVTSGSVPPTATAVTGPTATTMPSTPQPTVTPGSGGSDLIFSDNFESGNITAWSSSSIDKGDLSVSKNANISGRSGETQGLKLVINDNNSLFVTDDTPSSESRYRARFYFDPNTIKMSSGNAFFLFNGFKGSSTTVFRIEFGMGTSGYQVRARVLNDAGSWINSAWINISDAVHFLELDWRSAANAGGLTLWIDGAQAADMTGIDNNTLSIDRVRLGAVTGIDSGTRGTFYMDEFESHRQTYIGP
ncbi:MAG TPA: metallophosphoesterase [Anaerolineales bacterium]